MRIEQPISAVLAGACFVAFTQLSTRADMPGLLRIAWWILCVAIPVLASVSILPLVDDHVKAPAYEMIRSGLFFAAVSGAIISFGCIFEHFCRGAGFLFILTSASVYQLQRVSARRLKNKKDR